MNILIGSFLVGISKAGKFKICMAGVLYNKLLTNLVCLSHTWGILGLGRFLYEPSTVRSILPQPWANIAQYGPCARLLVKGYYFSS